MADLPVLDKKFQNYNGISNVDRDVLIWDEPTLNANKQFLRDNFGSYENGVNQLNGSWSTVLGGSEDFDGNQIAYSKMLQTDNGLKPLTNNYLYPYLDAIYNKSYVNGQFNPDMMVDLDRQGVNQVIDGQLYHIANMLAAVEGQQMNGQRLTADDVQAIGNPAFDDYGNDLMPNNNSDYKGRSMHDLQAEYLYDKYLEALNKSR